ncbi:hypothetical protein BH23ACT10_BH23ACT10_07400 [soil metagenome]
MLVLDASVLLAALTVDMSQGDRARSALVAGEPLHAPHVVDLKALLGICGLLAGGKLTSRRAGQVRTDFWDLAIRRHPNRGLVERVWVTCPVDVITAD